jgi:hypothetical protein
MYLQQFVQKAITVDLVLQNLQSAQQGRHVQRVQAVHQMNNMIYYLIFNLIAVQLNDLTKLNYEVSLIDIAGKVINKTTIKQGSTIAYFDTRTMYAGTYFVKISNGINSITKTVLIAK